MMRDEAILAAKKIKWANFCVVGYRNFAAFENSPPPIMDGEYSFGWGSGKSVTLGKSDSKMEPEIIDLRKPPQACA